MSAALLVPPGATVAALTIGVVLLTPGPTNTLLFLAGARQGVRRSLALIGAEWLAYCLAIGTWCAFLLMAAKVAPWAPNVARAAAATYVAYMAVKLWREASAAGTGTAPTIGPGRLFTVTLLNPKAFFFAAVVFSPVATGPAPLGGMYLLFTSLVMPIAALWIGMGALLSARSSTTPHQPLIHRIASVVLLGFSGSLAASLLH